MARGKKKETLTPEDRLQAALVPESEQPYKVPENCCWTRLGVLLQSSKEKTDEFSDSDLKYVGLEHMQKDGGIVAYDSAEGVKSLKNVFHPQQILYGKLRPYLNKHDIATFDGVCSTDILVFNATSITTPKFANFFLNQDAFIEYAVSNSKGINLPRVSESVVLDAKCPLPPLPEQQRIVDRIESLFAKLDEAKQKAQDALDSFETRKAAILHKAFTGELTAQWRKEHGIGMESWEKAILKNVCKVNPKKIDTNGLPDNLEVSFFPMASLSEINGEITEPQTRLLKDVKMGFTNFSEGDVVFAKITPCMENGKSAIIGELINDIGYGTTEFYVLRCGEKLYNRYLYHMVRDITFRNKAKSVMVGAVGQQRVPKSFMENYPLNLPSVPEQTEIVRILDDLLAKEQQAKETAEGVLEQIDIIKKSVLARAFRGELGTNDPSEESAVEMSRLL